MAAMLQAAGVHSAKAVEEAEDALALKVAACICSLASRHDCTMPADESSCCTVCWASARCCAAESARHLLAQKFAVAMTSGKPLQCC